jgi:ribosome-associated protein
MTNDISLVDISVQPIELCKLLKIANMVGGGGEAKIVISEGYVLLNNEVEFQKRKKVYHNDIVEFNGETIQVNYLEPAENRLSQSAQTQLKTVLSPSNKPKSAKQNKTDVNSQTKTTPSTDVIRSKRKPISF